jgi:septal ring factor EnvC (AmiA/AmiB activator)
MAGLLITAQAPIPSAHPAKEIEAQKRATAEKEKKLKAEMRALKNKLNKTKEDMVSVAANIKANEQNLIELEQEINKKKTEQEELKHKLDDDKATLSNLVMALERIRRVPPEALIAKPGTPIKTAQSAMLLNSILPSIYSRAETLRANLETLNDLTLSLEEDRKNAIETAKKLETNHKKLSKLMASRKNLYVQTTADHKKQQAELKRISQQAINLRDLVKRIEKKQREEEKAAKSRAKEASISTPRAYQRTPVPKSGAAQLPISGFIKTGYGRTDDIGAVSKGIKITGRPNALVVAPMGGVVDYAGIFKGYGNIVILRHERGYHSLIAGLDKIDTIVGRAVNAGEPIGKMPSNTSSDEEPALYYELRHKGKPVNPSRKISGLR